MSASLGRRTLFDAIGRPAERGENLEFFAPRVERLTLLICPSGGFLTGLSSLISDFPKNISVPTPPKSDLELFASHPTRGAYRDRHGRGEGCGGRGSVLRATGLQGGLAKGL
jgi:hypothetical protein